MMKKEKTIKMLSLFMNRFCVNERKTQKTEDLTFRCKKCPFLKGTNCKAKMFIRKNTTPSEMDELVPMGLSSIERESMKECKQKIK